MKIFHRAAFICNTYDAQPVIVVLQRSKIGFDGDVLAIKMLVQDLKTADALAKRFFGKQGRWAIAIDPSYISKAGKKTPHIGRFWSGCAQSVKHGLEIMGIGLIDIDAKDCMMLKAQVLQVERSRIGLTLAIRN